MRLAAVLAVCGSLAAASAAYAQTAEEAAVSALFDVCVPASETSGAPRDYAVQAGYQPDAQADPGLRNVFPIAGLSFTAPSSEGKVHVVSTVMPPPATPSSCLVTVAGNVSNVFALVRLRLEALGYAANVPRQSASVAFLDYQKTTGGAVDRVIGMHNLNPQGDGDMLLVAYRVE
jgi:hypothetical protein